MTFINIWDETGATNQCCNCGAKLHGFREVMKHQCDVAKQGSCDESTEKVVERHAEMLERLAQ
jgi:hypothetical protein